jgi:hypothetical protein
VADWKDDPEYIPPPPRRGTPEYEAAERERAAREAAAEEARERQEYGRAAEFLALAPEHHEFLAASLDIHGRPKEEVQTELLWAITKRLKRAEEGRNG